MRKKYDIILKRERAYEEKKKKTNLSNSFPTSTSQIFYHYTNLFPSSILSLRLKKKKKKLSNNKIQNLNYAFNSY
jgi:hypothetical protein